MEQKISLKKNFIMNMILTVSAFVFPFITFPYVSRVLGPGGSGKVSLATSWIMYFDMFAQLGIPTYGIRACAKIRQDREALTRTVHELLTISLISSALAYAALFAVMQFNLKMQQEKPLYLIISATILFNAIGMEWLYKGLEQYTYITKRSIFFKIISVIAMFLLVHRESDYVIYGAISIIAASGSNILNFIHAHKYVGIRPVGGYHYRRHLKAIGIFFAMACATTVYTNLDIVMLGHMKTDVDVGYYNAAVKIKNILVSIVTSLGAVLLPRASFYVEKKMMPEFWRITSKAFRFVCLFASPLAVYFIIFSREGILLLSGSRFLGAIAPMQLIMPTLLLIGLTNVMGIQILTPLGMEKTVLYSVIAGACTDVVLNLLLIPHLGASGASIGTLVAEFVVLVWQWNVLKKVPDEEIRLHALLKALPAILLASAASVWLKFVPLETVISSQTLRSLVVLAGSAVLFFGVYAGVLTAAREPLVLEIEQTVFGKIRGVLRRKQ